MKISKIYFKKNKTKLSKFKRFSSFESIFLYLLSFSFFGIGYSSFVINGSLNQMDVSLSVGDVISFNDCITNFKVESFDICEYGLVYDETIVYEAPIEFSFTIVSNKLLNFININNLENITFDLKLVNKGSFNFFHTNFINGHSSEFLLNYGYNFNNENINLDQSLQANVDNSGIITTQFTVSSDSIQTNDSINYLFSILFDFSAYKNTSSNANNFKLNIFDKLPDSNTLYFDIFLGAN